MSWRWRASRPAALPWTGTIAVRFARARRALYYAQPRATDPLHRAVAEVAQRIDEANRDEAWDAKRLRAHFKADPTGRTARRRRWLYLIPLLLATPAVLALGAGSYPQTTDLQNWFTSGTGHTLLLSCATAGLAWLILQMVLMLRARRAIGELPQGEPLTLLRLRLYGTGGALVVSALLLALRLKGYEADDRVVDPYVAATLFAALMEALMWAGIALALASVFLFPPAGGALAFVTVGGAMRIGTLALSPGARALLGSSAIALASTTGGGSASDGLPEANRGGSEAQPSKGRLAEQRGKQYERYLHEKLGGSSNFTRGGREFDGSYFRANGREVWYDGKAGEFWQKLNADPKRLAKFKATAGQCRQIATQHGKEYEIVSQNPIPRNITQWLDGKGIPWRVVP